MYIYIYTYISHSHFAYMYKMRKIGIASTSNLARGFITIIRNINSNLSALKATERVLCSLRCYQKTIIALN